MNEDEQHLRLLAIGHYVVAAITALIACFPLIHVAFGLFFFVNPPDPPPDGEPFSPRLFGLMFILVGGFFVLCGWAIAACLFSAGRSIAARKRYTFCFIVAAVACAFFPFGTILGVFSILVLSRPSVKALFAADAASHSPSADARGREVSA